MPAVFVHVSDIHFGQEKGDAIQTHTDVKAQLISDASSVVRSLSSKVATGILVTGDIVQSGKSDQYHDAGEWLDQLAEAVGCQRYDIQMVPGNHDLDRAKMSHSVESLLPKLRSGDAAEYENILNNDVDRAALFSRFENYARFSEAYNCPLNSHGKFTDKAVELAPHRRIRFVRMNSALLCTGTEKQDCPELFVGARQFAHIPRVAGEENIVLIHHPLSWFKDAGDAKRYIRSRARIFISGHEHNPRVMVESVESGCDFMMLAAGATVPFKSDERYTYTYNVLVFDWDVTHDALRVDIIPRAWNAELTRFDPDEVRLGTREPRYILQSPNFRRAAKLGAELVRGSVQDVDTLVAVEAVTSDDASSAQSCDSKVIDAMISQEPDGYRLLLLRFFRDISALDRLRILIEFGAVPEDLEEPITHSVEREFLDQLIDDGYLEHLNQRIDQTISARGHGGANE
ncbi:MULTISPECIES: metallophosphoesterase [Achromobacter]|uniref:Metallophosphoesterase n=1 Tax=Achromobacter spanius TaxID=217203 RepID=A0ABY8GS79_9BURK|nr:MULTISPECIES: metallophosphoesterase [Achromobacter]WAI83050.1 metallophosphoesterase [Achromobacter spanius]WEX93135.1 metallophosphoesterase [Achromobacter sp. SS2-2022]WFP07709.1 metallophosphoesterase [Achromobacter spanius]